MDKPLRLLAYTARYAGTNLEADLEQIQRASNRNNAAAGVTGALVYDRGRFVQVVEGPHEALDRLAARIQQDPRVDDWQLLLDTFTDHRSYDGWAMRILRTDRAPMLGADVLEAFRDQYLRTFKPDAAGFLELFVALLG